jgi:hypothetical protein
MSPLHLLGEYEALTQQHQEQFMSTLAHLQASVSETLNQLRQQERSLVEAQVQELKQLQAQLATNARCLLNSVELQAFVAEVQAIPAQARWQPVELPEVDANSAHWQLAQTDIPLFIRDYETTVDHDAYDDERTHSTDGYRVTIGVGQQSQPIEVLTKRIYSPIEEHSYHLRQQLEYYFEGEVAQLLSQQTFTSPQTFTVTESQSLLAQEISYLFGCAVRLLSLTPQTVQFRYSSTENREQRTERSI